jgi:hypothetical protein
MSVERKREMNSSDFEVDSNDLHFQSKVKTLKVLEGARTGLTVAALLCGITILGLSADALAVYNDTHIGQDFLLPLWPDNFNVRPTVALVAGSAIVVIANAVGLLFGKVKVVSFLFHFPFFFRCRWRWRSSAGAAASKPEPRPSWPISFSAGCPEALC